MVTKYACPSVRIPSDVHATSSKRKIRNDDDKSEKPVKASKISKVEDIRQLYDEIREFSTASSSAPRRDSPIKQKKRHDIEKLRRLGAREDLKLSGNEAMRKLPQRIKLGAKAKHKVESIKSKEIERETGHVVVKRRVVKERSQKEKDSDEINSGGLARLHSSNGVYRLPKALIPKSARDQFNKYNNNSK